MFTIVVPTLSLTLTILAMNGASLVHGSNFWVQSSVCLSDGQDDGISKLEDGTAVMIQVTYSP